MNDVMMKMGAVYITVNTDNTTGALSGLDVSPGNDGQNLGDGEWIVDEVDGSGSARAVDCIDLLPANFSCKIMWSATVALVFWVAKKNSCTVWNCC